MAQKHGGVFESLLHDEQHCQDHQTLLITKLDKG
jgi:hypothetical protein